MICFVTQLFRNNRSSMIERIKEVEEREDDRREILFDILERQGW